MSNANMGRKAVESRVVADITKVVDKVSSRCYRPSAMFQQTIQESMHSQLRYEEKTIADINRELQELADAHKRFTELQERAVEKQRRIEILYSLIGAFDYDSAVMGGSPEHKVAMELVKTTPEQLRASLPLWKAMEEYLKHTKEARIGEMESFFDSIGYAEGNRQAIESALRRHPKIFKTRKQKREKYISLK
jgi:cysteinyl-tRNA synthetase